MSDPDKVTSGAVGEPRTIKSKVLETGASATQVVVDETHRALAPILTSPELWTH